MVCGGSHGPGGVLGLEATAELYSSGVRSLGMRAKASTQKALHAGGEGWSAILAVHMHAGLMYHFECEPFCSPQIGEPQPTCSEWEGRVEDQHLGMHQYSSCVFPTTDR